MRSISKIETTFVILLLVAFWSLDSTVFAQSQNIRFDRLSIDDGLSNNEVMCLLQDSKGFMWIGTQDGLNKYDGYEFTVYKHDSKDSTSISDNYIRSIVETKDGFLWIGTESGGLNKYDPENDSFIHYMHVPGDSNSLSHNNVRIIFEDPDLSSNILWIGTMGGGLNKLVLPVPASSGNKAEGFNRQSKLFTQYTYSPDNSNSLSNNFIRTIYKDNTGILWIGTYNGLNKYDPENGSWTKYYHDPADPQSISNSEAKYIYEDRKGFLWVGTENGLNGVVRPQKDILDIQNTEDYLSFYVYDSNDSGSNLSNITSIFEDQFGMLWIGTHNGVTKLNRKNGTLINYHFDSGNPKSLSGNIINLIYEDRSGLLWFGTEGNGISILNRRAVNFGRFNHVPGKLNSLSHSSVRGIYEDMDGSLWVGGYGGLNRIDREKNLFAHYLPSNSELNSRFIYTIVGDPDNKEILWIGTEGDGLYRFDKNTGNTLHYFNIPNIITEYSLSNNFIFDLYFDSKRNLWIATHNGLNRMDKQTGKILIYNHIPDNFHSISSNNTRVIYEDRAGILWIGTETGGLNRLDKDTDQFTHFLHKSGNPESLSNNRIKSIYEDRKGRIWIGTNGGGLNLFDQETETFKHYTEKDGLPNDVIYGILEDDDGNLWLSTNWGISKFNPKTEVFRNYDVNDGLQSNEFNTASYFKSESGEMFFGGINGLNAFYPDSIKDNLHIPPIVITDFQIFNKPVPIGEIENGHLILRKHISETKEIQLSYKDDVFSFEFAVLSYAAPEKNKYAYKIEGFDSDWLFTDATRRFATYTHLDPGNYIFRVKGSNHDGIWNEEGVSIRISITPPPWKTWWAYTIYLIVVFGGIVGVIEWRLIQSRIRTRRLEYMVNERTAEVEQQKKEIEIQAEKLVELDKMKSRFFANISHEFRTPLTLVKGPLENLLNQKDAYISKTSLKHLALSFNNVTRLQKLIDELLDLSKLEAGKLKLETTLRDIVQFLRRVVDSFSTENSRDRITLKIIASDDKIDLYFDENKMETIVNNLLSNALKYTPVNGEISIEVTDVSPDYEEQGTGLFITIAVTDTGVGIPPDALPNIFDRFYQVERSEVGNYEGTGIGLALTKELVELHGGEITVESKMDEETTFVISLPKGRAHLADNEVVVDAKKNEKDSTIVNKGFEYHDDNKETDVQAIGEEHILKVLIVEDNTELREYLKDYLSEQYRVYEAENGKAGLEKALELQPDLIISDIMMPEVDGIEMLRKLKQNESTKIIPIILLTAKADVENRLIGFQAEADDYITKPFNMDEVKTRVNNLVASRQHMKDHFSRKVVTVEPEALELDSVDTIFLNQILSTVESHLSDQNFNVETLAKSVHLSKRQFDRKIQLLTGLSPASFIRQIRLKRAKQYLDEQAYSTIAEVAYNVGFNNVKYFSRLYHQTFGQFPSEMIRV